MISSLQHLGQDAADLILLATANPFTGLYSSGCLLQQLIQSSSATTAMAVALVASGARCHWAQCHSHYYGCQCRYYHHQHHCVTRLHHQQERIQAGCSNRYLPRLLQHLNCNRTALPLEYYFGFLSAISTICGKQSCFNEPLTNSPGKFFFTRLGCLIPSSKLIVTTINNEFVLVVLSVCYPILINPFFQESDFENLLGYWAAGTFSALLF
jgi:hypothetical protein